MPLADERSIVSPRAEHIRMRDACVGIGSATLSWIIVDRHKSLCPKVLQLYIGLDRIV